MLVYIKRLFGSLRARLLLLHKQIREIVIIGLVVGYLLGSRIKFGAMLIFDYDFSTMPLIWSGLPY